MNRKKTAAFILLSILLLSIPVNASNSLKKTVDILYGIALQINGKAPALQDANGQPVSPFTLNGTTYVPIRAVATELGYDVSYDAKSNTATVRKTSIVANAANVLPVYQLLQGEVFNAFTTFAEIPMLQHLHTMNTEDRVLTASETEAALKEERDSIVNLSERIRKAIEFFTAANELPGTPQYARNIYTIVLTAYDDMQASLIYLDASVASALEYRNTSSRTVYNNMRNSFAESILAIKDTNSNLIDLYRDISDAITKHTKVLY